MRCRHYRGGVSEGEKKNAPASGATSGRLRAWLRHGHFFFCHLYVAFTLQIGQFVRWA